TAGSGPPLVLLHGLLGFSFSFSENLAALSQIATVYSPDFLNTGYSERTRTGATLSDLANQVSNFMAALGIPRADLLASSHRGAVAGYAAPLRDSQGLDYCIDVARAWRSDFESLKSSMPLLSDVPTLLVWGTHDPVVPLETGRALLSELHRAKLVTLDAGHLP